MKKARDGEAEAKGAHKEAASERVRKTLEQHSLANAENPALLMVSGGSDSTALAYIMSDLQKENLIGKLAILHVNHRLRGAESDTDQVFVQQLAELLAIPLFICEIDVGAQARLSGDNIEAVARRERYLAADEALRSLCLHEMEPLSKGRIFTAHTQDDRVENFYMRSIVGTGPGGFRSMKYRNGPVVRPLMDLDRKELRTFIFEREQAGEPVVCDVAGNLWREDATNAHTDRFRAYVRHEIVPKAKERNEQLLDTLCRTMNLIADEDDMLEMQAEELLNEHFTWIGNREQTEMTEVAEEAIDYEEGCVIAPAFGLAPLPLQRRACIQALHLTLGAEERIETATIESVLGLWENGIPKSGKTENIQGNLAASSNKHAVRIEPMSAYRARRKNVRKKKEGRSSE